MASSRDGETDKRVRKTSIAWSYFTLTDEENSVATCNTCDAQISFRSSISNLMKHVRRKHSELEAKMSDEDKDSESETEDAAKLILSGDEDKAEASLVWEHFEVTSSDKKIATCAICRVPLSYKSSVRALLKHLHRKHNIGQDVEVLLSDNEEKIPTEPLEQPPAFRSAIWPYFRVTDAAGKAARCLVCKKLLSYNTGTSNLRKHLMRKHPLIKLPAPGEERKTIILSSGDQLYEFEATKGENEDEETDAQDEPVAIDEIFLDEFNGSINQIEKEDRPKTKKRKHKSQNIVIEPSDSDDEVVLKKKYVKKELDTIDLFAKYLGSLLKELPKQVSNRLQKDFVRQIMNAQAEAQSSNAYSITLSNDSVYVPDDVRIEVIAKEEAGKIQNSQNVFK
ncbi:hypothetical protein MSG28_014860 [Choristoneura fumiferana]|uniref:Uncharacterized protein n=1 Tax=Choristoneura fumiferana TaxID=7141 RepID=A0ACC0JSZ9_CHOFU|nr:hypothetical protein MSG28_014860 [Choristoneura fumiferana]